MGLGWRLELVLRALKLLVSFHLNRLKVRVDRACVGGLCHQGRLPSLGWRDPESALTGLVAQSVLCRFLFALQARSREDEGRQLGFLEFVVDLFFEVGELTLDFGVDVALLL